MVGCGGRSLRDAGSGDADRSAGEARLTAEQPRDFGREPARHPLGDGEIKMQTLTTLVTWSAVAIAVFMGVSALMIGSQPFIA